MFAITDADAAAIRDIFDEEGELSAAIEVRRRFPGVIDTARARACARTIAGWTPLPAPPSPVTRLRSRKDACSGFSRSPELVVWGYAIERGVTTTGAPLTTCFSISLA
jgi:hypothetical protein